MELQTLNTHFLEHKALIQKLLRESEIALNFYEQFNESQVRLGAIMATFKQHQNNHSALKYWIESLKLEETKADYLKAALDKALNNVNSIIQTQGQAPPQYATPERVVLPIEVPQPHVSTYQPPVVIHQAPTPVYQAPIQVLQQAVPISESNNSTHSLALVDENLTHSSNNSQNTEGVSVEQNPVLSPANSSNTEGGLVEQTQAIIETQVIVEEVINQKVAQVYYAYEPAFDSKAFEGISLVNEHDGMTVYKLTIYQDGKNGIFTIIEDKDVYEYGIGSATRVLGEACDFLNEPQSSHTRIETEQAGKIRLSETDNDWTIIQKATIKFL